MMWHNNNDIINYSHVDYIPQRLRPPLDVESKQLPMPNIIWSQSISIGISVEYAGRTYLHMREVHSKYTVETRS